MDTKKLIPGFRFHPYDVDLLVFFLKRKVMGKKIPYDVIAEVEIEKYAPWDLPDKSSLKSGDLEWYFFCPREKKYASGTRMNRATEVGYWKITGKDRLIRHENRVVGMKKTLVFFTGRAPRGVRTDWVMHEFRLEDRVLADKGIPQDSYVLCKIIQKVGLGPRDSSQYERPFNYEYWDDKEEIDGVGYLPLIGLHAPITVDPNTPGSSIATHGHPPVSICVGSSPSSCLMYPSAPTDQVLRHEAEIAGESTEFIVNILGDEIPSNFTHLVEDIQSGANRIISFLRNKLNDTCFIGIWGESGIGKTTLARLVYNEIQSEFDATCFLDNVRTDSERAGIVSLQKKLLSELGLGERDIDDFSEGAEIIRKLLSHKKFLIILDDVSDRCQLENLAGNKEWFGTGSKIVIITDNKMLLMMYEQFEGYEVGRLPPGESLKLLSLEAFKKDEPEKGYLDLSKEVIECACRLPLVLKVLGSFLSNKDQYEWKNASERLRQNSPTDISSQLRISFDGLEDEEYKRIFLDIACFFNREPKLKVTNILELCGPQSTSGIKTSEIIKALVEKSMLNVTHSNSDLRQNEKDQDMLDMVQKMRRDIFLPTYLYDWLLQEASKEYLYMHDLLQEMGRDIVSQESPTDAGGCSRLWSLKDVNDVLKENKGTRKVESLVLHIQQSFEADWHPDCLSNMRELRLLDLSKVHLSRNLNSLPSALKVMRWEYYALESLPPVDELHELESLQLCNSKIRKLWNGALALGKLRIIDLSDSECLETPDFSGTPNLEELVLNRCRKLVQVHESVGQLKKLVKLNLQECRRLESLPTYLETDNLTELILSGCLKLEKLPEFGRNMGNLYFLDVRGTDITEIPQSIVHLTKLKCLDLTFCSRLKSVPKLPPNLIISASNCGFLEPTSALRQLYASCAPMGPIHLFCDFQLWTRIPTWFEQWEYCWGKDTSGEFVTISADIPSNVVADSNEEHWGIAVCVVFQFLSKAWLGFSVNWKFEDKCHPKKTKIHGTPAYYMHDCRVYIGFYPFDTEDCRRHASGEGSQLDLTLEFPATNIIKGLHDLEIMGCGWRLACKKDFDELSESRAPSPLRLDFLNR